MSINLDLEHIAPPPKRKDYRIGAIGAGFIMNDCHLVAYGHAGYTVVAIASSSPQESERVAQAHGIPKVYGTYQELLADPSIEVIDIAVPPDKQLMIVREAVKHSEHLKGILAQKPLAMNYADSREIVRLCEQAGITLGVNQNMRYDHSMRALKTVLRRGYLGEPVLASIEMRAIPHWKPWQTRVHAPYLAEHEHPPPRQLSAICSVSRRAFTSARDRIPELPLSTWMAWCFTFSSIRAASAPPLGTTCGAARRAKARRRTCTSSGGWKAPKGWRRGPSAGLPIPAAPPALSISPPGRNLDAGFRHAGRKCGSLTLLKAPWASCWRRLPTGAEPAISGRDNLKTMALVEACYRSIEEHRPVRMEEM